MKTALTAIVVLSFLTTSFGEPSDKNTYANPTLGVTVTKPSEWQFVTAEQNAENLARTQLKDEEMSKLVQKYATAPLVAMMKYPEPYDDLNPSFKMNIKPLGSLSGEDPKQILSVISTPMKNMFQDFLVVTPPSETTVSGLKAAYMKIHYSLQIPDGRSFPTCSELWIVPRGKFFFMIGAGTRQDEKTGKREEVGKIIDSVKIEKQ